jgi:hypothetical protein
LFRNPEEGKGSQRAVVPVMMMMMMMMMMMLLEVYSGNEFSDKSKATSVTGHGGL